MKYQPTNSAEEPKFHVDKKRIPGKFLLLGSTEFSKLTQIRESLTGRLTRVRFFPFTIAEALQQKHENSDAPFFLHTSPSVNRGEFMRHLEQGGLPGLFAIRDEEEKKQAAQ